MVKNNNDNRQQCGGDEAHARNHVRINYKFMSNELFFITSCDFSILHGTQVKYIFYLSIACMLSIFPS